MAWGLMAIVHSTGQFALQIDSTGIHPTTALIAKVVICYGVAYVVMDKSGHKSDGSVWETSEVCLYDTEEED